MAKKKEFLTQVGDIVAQGDVLFVRVAKIPKSAQKKSLKGPVVVQYGEVTGHQHAFYENAELYYDQKTDDEVEDDLYVGHVRIKEGGAVLKHGKNAKDKGDHLPINFPAGDYVVHRQREYRPEDESSSWVLD